MQFLSDAPDKRTETSRQRAGIGRDPDLDVPYVDMPTSAIPDGTYTFKTTDFTGLSGDLEAGADTAKAIVSGTLQLASSIVALAEIAGVLPAGKATGYLNEKTAQVVQSMSPSARVELGRKFATLQEEGALRNPKSLWLNLMQQVPQLAVAFGTSGAGASLATGGKAGRIAAATTAKKLGQKAAEAAATKGALLPGQILAERAAKRVAMEGFNRAAMVGGAAAGGLSEGALTAGDAANTLISEIMALEGVSDAEKQALVQEIHERGDVSDVFGMAALTGAPGGAVIGRITKGLRLPSAAATGALGRAGRVVGTGAAEAGQETLQEGWQAILENKAAGATYDPGRDPMANVGERAAAGGAMGFLSGGALGALTPGARVDDADIDAALRSAEEAMQKVTPRAQPPGGGGPSPDIRQAIQDTIVPPRGNFPPGQLPTDLPKVRAPASPFAGEQMELGLNPMGDSRGQGNLFAAQEADQFQIDERTRTVRARGPESFVHGIDTLFNFPDMVHSVVVSPDVLRDPETRKAVRKLYGVGRGSEFDDLLSLKDAVGNIPFAQDPFTGDLVFSKDVMFLARVATGAMGRDTAQSPVEKPSPTEQMEFQFPPPAERLTGGETYTPDYSDWTAAGRTRGGERQSASSAFPHIFGGNTSEKGLTGNASLPVAPFESLPRGKDRGELSTSYPSGQPKQAPPKRMRGLKKKVQPGTVEREERLTLTQLRRDLADTETTQGIANELARRKRRTAWNLKNWQDRIPAVSTEELRKELRKFIDRDSRGYKSEDELLAMYRAWKGLPTEKPARRIDEDQQSPAERKANQLAADIASRDLKAVGGRKGQQELALDYRETERRVAEKQKARKPGRALFRTRGGKEVTAADAITEAWDRFTRRYVEHGVIPSKEQAEDLLRELRQLEGRDRAVEQTLKYRHETAEALYELTQWVDEFRAGNITADELVAVTEPALESFKDQRNVRQVPTGEAAVRAVRKELAKRGTQGRPQVTEHTLFKTGKRKGLVKKTTMRPVPEGKRQLEFPFTETTAAQKTKERERVAANLIRVRTAAHRDSPTGRWYAGPVTLPAAMPPVSVMLDPQLKATFDKMVADQVAAGLKEKEAKTKAWDYLLKKAKTAGERATIRQLMAGKTRWSDVLKDNIYENLAITYVAETLGMSRIEASNQVRSHIEGMSKKPRVSPFTGNTKVINRVNEILAGTQSAQKIARELEEAKDQEKTIQQEIKDETGKAAGTTDTLQGEIDKENAGEREKDITPPANTVDTFTNRELEPGQKPNRGQRKTIKKKGERTEREAFEDIIDDEEVATKARTRKPKKEVVREQAPTEEVIEQKPDATPVVDAGRAGPDGAGATASTGREPRGIEALTPIRADTPRQLHPGSHPNAVGQPFSYQFDAANMALHRMDRNPDGSITLLADDPGVGKTMTMMLLALDAVQKGKPALIVVNNLESGAAVFVREAARLGRLELLKQVYFASYNRINRSIASKESPYFRYSDENIRAVVQSEGGKKSKPSVASPVPKEGFFFAALDEAHATKHEQKAVASAIRAVQVRHKLHVTATAGDSYESLAVYAEIAGQSLREFLTSNGAEIIGENKDGGLIIGNPGNADLHLNIAKVLSQLMESYAYIRRTLTVPTDYENLEVSLDEARAHDVAKRWTAVYDKLRSAWVRFNKEGNINMKNAVVGQMAAASELMKAPFVLQRIIADIKAGRKVVVISERVTEGKSSPESLRSMGLDAKLPPAVDYLIQELQKLGYSVGEYSGSGNTNLEKVREDFQSNALDVIVGHITKAGQSIDLDDQSPGGKFPRTMYIMTPPWSYSQQLQAERRVARATTTSKAKVVMVTMPDVMSDDSRLFKLSTKEDITDVVSDPNATIKRGGRSKRTVDDVIRVSDAKGNTRVRFFSSESSVQNRLNQLMQKLAANKASGVIVTRGIDNASWLVRTSDWPMVHEQLRNLYADLVGATVEATPAETPVVEKPKKTIKKKAEPAPAPTAEEVAKAADLTPLVSTESTVAMDAPTLASALGYEHAVEVDTQSKAGTFTLLVGHGRVDILFPDGDLVPTDSIPPVLVPHVRQALMSLMNKIQGEKPGTVPARQRINKLHTYPAREGGLDAKLLSVLRDPNTVSKFKRRVDARELLTAIAADDAATLENRHILSVIARQLLTAMGDRPLSVEVPLIYVGKSAGRYNPVSDAIELNWTRFDQAPTNVILHEIVHALTYHLMRSDDSFRNEMTRIYEFAKNAAGPSDEYGFDNVDEFVSEALSSDIFQSVLDAIPVTPKLSVMQRVVDWIKRKLGMNVPERHESVLNEVIRGVFPQLRRAPDSADERYRIAKTNRPIDVELVQRMAERTQQIIRENVPGTRTVRGAIRRGFGLPLLNTSAIASWFSDKTVFKDWFQGDEETGNLLQNVADAKAQITKYKEDYLTSAGNVHRALSDDIVGLAPEMVERAFRHFMDTSVYGVWPDSPFDDPGGRNHHLMYLRSKDENGEWNQRKQEEIDINRRHYDRIVDMHQQLTAVDPRITQAYTKLVEFYKQEWEDTAYQLLRNVLYSFDFVWSTTDPETSPAVTTAEKDVLARRFMQGATIEDLVGEVKTDTHIGGSFEITKYDSKERRTVIDKELTDTLYEYIRDIQNRARLDGPYIGAKRYGSYITEATRNEREIVLTNADIDLPNVVKALRDKFARKYGELVDWGDKAKKEYDYELQDEISKAFKRILRARKHLLGMEDRTLMFDNMEVVIDEKNLETGTHQGQLKYRDYDFQLHETETAMHDEAKAMRDDGWRVATGSRTQYMQTGSLSDASSMKNRVLARIPETSHSGMIRNAIAAAYIEMMPETSIRKAELHRKNRAGFSLDLTRGFAEHAAHAAHYKAQLEFGNQLKEAMSGLVDYKRVMQEEAARLGTFEADKRSVIIGDIVEELQKRHQIDSMPYTRTAIVDAASQLGFLYMLTGTSYWMIGLTQPWMFGMPVLWAQRAGRKKSTKSTWKYLAEAEGSMIPEAMRRAKKAGLGFGFLAGKKADADLFSFLDAPEAGSKRTTLVKEISRRIDQSKLNHKDAIKSMLVELGERQVLTMGLHTDMQSAARGKDVHGGMMQWMYVMPQISEMLGRTSVAIAAYNLSRDTTALTKDADAHKEAVDAAYAAVRDSMFIYDPADRNRYMSGKQPGFGAAARLVFMFQMHSANVYSLMLREFHALLKTWNNKTPEGRARMKQAVRTMGGIIGTHFAAAGLIGATFEPVKWLWALTLMMLGKFDDDPEEPWEVVMERGLIDVVGPTLGGILAKGLPYGLLNMDVHGRLSISSLSPLSQMIRYGGQYEGKDAFIAALASAVGPLGSIGGNIADGWSQITNEGDWVGGIEKASPRIVKDLLKTYRLASEGMRDSGGNLQRADHPGIWELFVTGAGFRTGSEELTATRRNVVFNLRIQYENRKRVTLEKIKRLRTEKEFYQAGRVRDEYNRTAPSEYRIGSDDVNAMLKRQVKAERSVERYGVQLAPREKTLRKAVTYLEN